MFNLKNVRKSFGDLEVLKNINGTIDKGLTVILGPSGSGKSTLLRILSGMDLDYEGSVTYGQKELKDIKNLDVYYNQVFGFVWQEAHLIESMSVMEHILLPQYLLGEPNQKEGLKLLKEFGLHELRDAKIKNLSGGEKQRVAIICELMKNPKVIFADEPTSALDPKNAKELMQILRRVSKKRQVIMFTHDESLLEANDHVLRMHQGQFEVEPKSVSTSKLNLKLKNQGLTWFNALKLTSEKMIQKPFEFGLKTMIILICSVLMVSGMSGVVKDQTSNEFDQLYETYGDQLFDISVVGSFMGASGTQVDENGKPVADVNQNIIGLFEAYEKDPRIQIMAYIQAYDDINVVYNGQKISIETSNNVPVINKLLSGAMPQAGERGILVPSTLVEKMGLTNESAIGETIQFSAFVKGKFIDIEVPILGVIDSRIFTEDEGETYEYPIDDSFFLSRVLHEELQPITGIDPDTLNFMMRTDSPQSLMEIKSELDAKGIIPLGMFELVKDLVDLGGKTESLSQTSSLMMVILAQVSMVTVMLIMEIIRRKDVAIYKASGYKISDLMKIAALDLIPGFIGAFVLTLALFPSHQLFIVGLVLLSLIVSFIVMSMTQIQSVFKGGNQL